ncbi:hypothetical protein SAMN04487897_1316 [Paenibacillus sp. yr247]|uniref:hypothetical protein n=1 Tax=Paenibacillus sp. yr247 TaxID=1761880 RepID=UPI000884C8DD|nr:hypothetical protein [Paenibacillus sp. yr247]SDP01783.1 hypothetical protein SAMN04487897_1316 [Paenibacillus sp. yr247]
MSVKVVDMHDNFKCACGNTSFGSGFFPCDNEGNYVEPDSDWIGYYKCEACGQIYSPVENERSNGDTKK